MRSSNSNNSTKVFSRHLRATRLPGPGDPVHESTSEMLHHFRDVSSTLSYEPGSVPAKLYKYTDGVELHRLVDREESTMVAACSDGNAYAVVAACDEDSIDCSTLWAATGDRILVLDAVARAMHYSPRVMRSAGVSRLRFGPIERLPRSSRAVVWTVEHDPHAPEGRQSYYLVRNAEGDVFYPLVCEYDDDASPKVFLAKDPEESIKTLEGPHVVFSTTGGSVSKCHGLLLLQAEPRLYGSQPGASEDDYFTYGSA